MVYTRAAANVREALNREKKGRKPRALIQSDIPEKCERMKILLAVRPKDAVRCLLEDAPEKPIAKWYARENYRSGYCQARGLHCCMK